MQLHHTKPVDATFPGAAAMKNRPLRARLGFAFSGIRIVHRRERSFRTQTLLAVSAMVATSWLQPELVWVALMCLTIGLVLGLEMINSALEYLIDRVHPDYSVEIKHAKDSLAGAVLIASLASPGVGGTMLLSIIST